MNKNLEGIIALYGTSKEGKSSTLRELINLMTGIFPKKRRKDYRVVIKGYNVKGEDEKVNVFIATCGDTQEVLEDNIRFFNSKMPAKNPPIFIFDYGTKTWGKVKNEDQLKDIEANICISACRTEGGGVDAMRYFINSKLSYTFFSAWIRLAILRAKLGTPKDMKKPADWNKIAGELKKLIDQIISR